MTPDFSYNVRLGGTLYRTPDYSHTRALRLSTSFKSRRVSDLKVLSLAMMFSASSLPNRFNTVCLQPGSRSSVIAPRDAACGCFSVCLQSAAEAQEVFLHAVLIAASP